MKRVTVTLEDDQAEALAKTLEESRIPVSALVRYAVGLILSDKTFSLSEVHTRRMQRANTKKVKATK